MCGSHQWLAQSRKTPELRVPPPATPQGTDRSVQMPSTHHRDGWEELHCIDWIFIALLYSPIDLWIEWFWGNKNKICYHFFFTVFDTVFKISAGLWTLTSNTGVGPAGFPQGSPLLGKQLCPSDKVFCGGFVRSRICLSEFFVNSCKLKMYIIINRVLGMINKNLQTTNVSMCFYGVKLNRITMTAQWQIGPGINYTTLKN